MYLEAGGERYVVTMHAQYRMKKRKITEEDLVEAIEKCRSKRKQYRKEGQTEDTYLVMGRNKVSFIVSEHNVIITIYNHQKEVTIGRIKSDKNKNRRQLKKKYGSRVKI